MFDMLIVALIGIAVAALAFGYLGAILRNVRKGQGYRNRLAERLEDLRLNRILALFGIDRDNYLHNESVVAIARHMRNCADCAATDDCDRHLEQPASAEAFSFCPNFGELQPRAGSL